MSLAPYVTIERAAEIIAAHPDDTMKRDLFCVFDDIFGFSKKNDVGESLRRFSLMSQEKVDLDNGPDPFEGILP